MRLQPVQLDGGEGADIQTVDVRCIDQLSLPLLLASLCPVCGRADSLVVARQFDVAVHPSVFVKHADQ